MCLMIIKNWEIYSKNVFVTSSNIDIAALRLGECTNQPFTGTYTTTDSSFVGNISNLVRHMGSLLL